MATLDVFGLLDVVEAAPGVIEAQGEYRAAMAALKDILPAALFDALWRAVLAIDEAHGRVMCEMAMAGFAAAGGELREVHDVV